VRRVPSDDARVKWVKRPWCVGVLALACAGSGERSRDDDGTSSADDDDDTRTRWSCTLERARDGRGVLARRAARRRLVDRSMRGRTDAGSRSPERRIRPRPGWCARRLEGARDDNLHAPSSPPRSRCAWSCAAERADLHRCIRAHEHGSGGARVDAPRGGRAPMQARTRRGGDARHSIHACGAGDPRGRAAPPSRVRSLVRVVLSGMTFRATMEPPSRLDRGWTGRASGERAVRPNSGMVRALASNCLFRWAVQQIP
jgi:hypothetical protein